MDKNIIDIMTMDEFNVFNAQMRCVVGFKRVKGMEWLADIVKQGAVELLENVAERARIGNVK